MDGYSAGSHPGETISTGRGGSAGGLRLGYDYGALLQKVPRKEPVYWDRDKLANCHVGVLGMSGSGKSHFIRQFIANLPPDVLVEVLDYHADLDIEGAHSLIFSPHTRYGYNPLIVERDPHFGGVRRAISNVIAAINATSNPLGARQINVLTNLMLDTYAERGILPDEPDTWRRRVGTTREIEAIANSNTPERLFNYYPTLSDVLTVARRRLRAMLIGVKDTGNGLTPTMALQAFLKSRGAVFRAAQNINTSRENGADSADRLNTLQANHDELLEACVVSFREFLELMETEKDLDNAVNYSNKDLLQSVVVRLEGLINVGIFEPNPPPWGNSRVRRYILRPLAQSPAELQMFVRFRLQDVIREMMQEGSTDGRLRRVIVLDEAKIFNSEEMSNPINIIATQMRKFGLGLLQAGQSPGHLSDDFLKNAGTLMLLNMATGDYDEAVRRLKIKPEVLRFLKPRKIAAVRQIEVGGQAEFRGLYLR